MRLLGMEITFFDFADGFNFGEFFSLTRETFLS